MVRSSEIFLKIYVISIFVAYASSNLVKLSLMKAKGTFRDNPSYFLSKGNLEVMEGKTESEVILCDVFPVPVARSDYLEPKPTVKDYCNRDGGIFDNLPYSWGNKATKKQLFDACSFDLYSKCLSGKYTAEQAFCEGLKSILDLEILSLIIEIADQRSKNKISLGAAVVVSKAGFSNVLNYDDSLSKLSSSGKVSSEESICVVDCHMDELIGLAYALNKPILVADELVNLVSTDALLIKVENSKDYEVAIKCPPHDTPETDQIVNDDEESSPAWEIFNPAVFLGMSNVEKRAVLRASGVTSLPRPREGAKALDSLLTDLMDDAVRAEYFRIVATQDAVKSKSKGTKTTKKTATQSGGGDAVAGSENSRQELLRKMGEALDAGDLASAEKLRERFAVQTIRLADPTQPKGSYDRFLDQDDWYLEARRKAMAPRKTDSS